MLELFEGEEVVPVGVVLDAGDAIGEDVGDGDGEGLTALLEARRWNFFEDEGVGGGFPENAGGRAGGIAAGPINLRAGGVGGGFGAALAKAS